MKNIISILIACALFASCGSKGNPTWLTQAFGDFIRSNEGRYTAEQLPGIIIAGRNKWLPAGEQWDKLAATVIEQYVKANPQNDAEVNKVLEDLAMKLNTNTIK